MTVITALKHNGRVFMAADSMASDASGLVWDGSTKLFEKILGDGTRLVVGNCGNSSVGAVFRYDDTQLRGPSSFPGESDDWAHSMALHLTQLCRENHEVDKDGDPNLCMLVACGSDVWEITSNYAQPVQTYVSIGSGAQVAQGALWVRLDAIEDYKPTFSDGQAEMFVSDAVRAACRWERSCREPVISLTT